MILVRAWLTVVVSTCLLCEAQESNPAAKYQGRPVTAVVFVPEQQPLDSDELASLVRVKRGQPLRVSDVHNTIERLFATGRYLDIQADAEAVAAPVR